MANKLYADECFHVGGEYVCLNLTAVTVGTATALAANGTNCSAGNYPLGVDASGNAESCTAVGAGTNYWTIGNVGINTTNNVGISSVNPGAKLDVVGTARISGNLTTNITGSTQCVTADSSGVLSGTGSACGSGGGAGTVGIGTTGRAIVQIGTTTTGTPYNNVFDSNGNFGIGSSSPGVALDINGAIRSIGTGDSKINETSGNVGIGSSAPGTKLDIQGTARTTGFQLSTGPSSGYVLVTNSVGVGTWMSPSSIGAGGGGSGTINSGTTNRVARYTGSTTLDSSVKIFDDATNVGIGTIAPRSAVELGVQVVNIVGSNVGVGSLAPGVKLDVSGTARATVFQGNTAAIAGISSAQGIGLDGVNQDYTTGNLVVNTTGNVGINTATAPNKLYVVGTPMFTGGLNIGIGTASMTRLCIANGAVAVCP